MHPHDIRRDAAAGTVVRHPADAETLGRLSRLELDGHRALSVYMNLDPEHFATAGARASEETALLTRARHAAVGPDHDLLLDVADVERMLAAEPQLKRGVAALAIFSAHAAGVLEVVGLPRPVASLVTVERIPWLAPLVGAIPLDGVAVAVVDRRGATVLRDAGGRLAEAASIDDPVHGRHDQGGWSQSRYQRSIEEQVSAHVRHVAAELAQADRREPFAHLVLVASAQLAPDLRRALPDGLRRRLTDVVEADLAEATTAEIEAVVRPVIVRAQQQHADAVLARVSDALGVGGPAAAGLPAVVEALAEERVATLVVDPADAQRARVCPRCGALTAPPAATCAADGGALLEVDAAAYAVHAAARQGADLLCADAARLGALGGIAALLRW